MDQAQYLDEVLTKAGIKVVSYKPISIPMNGYDCLKPTGPDDTRADKQKY